MIMPGELLRRIRSELDGAGLRAAVLVRDVRSGAEIGINSDAEYPLTSLVKVPLAMATLHRIHTGELDASAHIEFLPAQRTPGPTGLSQFRSPARIGLHDVVYMSTALSDNTAADALFQLTPPSAVMAYLHGVGLYGITVRHDIGELSRTIADRLQPADAHLAQSLAVNATTSGRGHRIPQLDVARSNTGSPRALVDLLQSVWTQTGLSGEIATQIQQLMSANVHRQRLAPDLVSDTSTWSSKTGTLLNLRHEMGVVQHADGDTLAIAILTESSVPAHQQPVAEHTMARVARALHDHLRTK